MKTTGKTYKEQSIYGLLSIAKGGKAWPGDKMGAAEKVDRHFSLEATEVLVHSLGYLR